MIIKELGLQSFGKFIDKTIDFSDGINVIYGNNEKGKSTIHQFIESFFSMKSGEKNPKIDRYNPWSAKDDFRGHMTIDLNQKHYHLKADFLDQTLEVYDQGSQVVTEEALEQQTFMNLIGVQDFGMANSKDFIHEIQNKIVNIKNANHVVIHYEEAVNQLAQRMDNLKNDAYYMHIEKDLASAIDKKKGLLKEIASLHMHVENLYRLRQQLDVYLKSKERIIDSIAVEVYEQLVNRIARIDTFKIELDEIEASIEHNEVFAKNTMEEVDAYIEAVQDVNSLLRQVEDNSNKIKVLKNKQKELGLTQSEKAIKLMAEDMYANDFILDVEQYIEAEASLKVLEETRQEEAGHQQGEDPIEAEKELESDYMSFLTLKNNLSHLESQMGRDHDLISNETRLELIARRAKPLTIYTGTFALLLMVALLAILVNPDYLMIAGVAAALFAIGTLAFVFNKFQNNQEINQLKFIIGQLEEEAQMKADELEDIHHGLNQIYTKYGVVDHMTFEQYYIQQKRSNGMVEDPRLRLIHIENKMNDLTAKKNMLYRRVRKWILDAELDEDITAEDKEKMIPIVEAHSRKCVSFMAISNDIFRFEYMVRQDQGAIEDQQQAIEANPVYALLITMTLDEVKRMKMDYMALLKKQEQVDESIKALLKNLTYDQLLAKANEKKQAIEGIDVANRIPGDKEGLQDRLTLTNDNISHTRSEIQDNRELVNTLSMTKGRLLDVKRDIARFEEILQGREAYETCSQKALEAIEGAANYIKESYTDDLTESVGKVLYQLTGAYDEVQITSDYEFYVKNKEKGRSVPIEQLSRGLLDQLYFAVRIGLMDTVNRQDQTPLVLDDTFVHYDDDRLANVLKVISQLNRQMIILTCQKREMTLLNQLSIPYNEVSIQ